MPPVKDFFISDWTSNPLSTRHEFNRSTGTQGLIRSRARGKRLAGNAGEDLNCKGTERVFKDVETAQIAAPGISACAEIP